MTKTYSILAAFSVMWLAPAGARGAGVGGSRVTIKAFFQCVKGGKCKEKRVFFGKDAIKIWSKMKKEIGDIRIQRIDFVRQVPAEHLKKWNNEWKKAVRSLAAKGYEEARLKKLGNGDSVIDAGNDVVVALISATTVRWGRSKTQYALLVLWQDGRTWKIRFWDDSTRSVSRFMAANKPPQKKKKSK